MARRLITHRSVHPSVALWLALTVLILSTTLLAETPPPYDWTYSFGTVSPAQAAGDGISRVVQGPNGDLFVTGWFGYADSASSLSADFDPSPQVKTRMTAGRRDAVVVRLSPAGEFRDTVTFGGVGDDMAWGLTVLDDGSFIVAGHFTGTVDFDPGPAITAAGSAGGTDVFVSKFDADGVHLWTKTLGGAGDDQALGLTPHPGGGFVLFGEYSQTVDFDPGPGMESRTAQGFNDAFVLRLTSEGEFISVTSIGGPGGDHAHGVAVDEQGTLFVAGGFGGTVDFDPEPALVTRTAVGSEDAYLCRFNPDGALAWVWTIGSPGQDVATDVKLSPNGEPIVVGLFGTTLGSIDFDPTDGVDLHRTSRTQEAYVTKLGPDQSYRWTRTTGTSGFAYANTLAVGADGIVVAGAGSGNVNFSPTEPVAHTVTLRGQEGYAWRMSLDGAFEWVFSLPNPGTQASSIPLAVEYDALGNLLCAGLFSKTVDFDPSTNVATKTSVGGGDDAFLLKLRGFVPTADHNDDDLVDLRDFASFQTCFGGVSAGTPCKHFDFDESLRVDAGDVVSVTSELIGP